MKKITNKGFMLIETLVVTTFIFSTLIFLYVQFRTINSSYKVTFNYNSANGLYSTNHIKQYILEIGYLDLVLALEENKYVDITDCPVQYLSEINYCENLFNKLGVKQVIFTNQNLGDLKEYLLQARPFEEDFSNFIKFINYDEDINQYRLIVSFNDNTYASLKIF